MPATRARALTDSLTLGDQASEQSHQLAADNTESIKAALGQTARRLLPSNPATFDGGAVSFTMKVDPVAQNYVTAKFWGSDKGTAAGRLLLWANGLQVGYRHEGDYDVLNQCDEEGEAPGRFFYQTLPLPIALTRGKTSIDLKISALGPMWVYGQKFAEYQKSLVESSRGIYRVYVHTEPRFVPDQSDVQGAMPDVRVRADASEEVIAQSKQIVIDRLNKMLEAVDVPADSANRKALSARMELLCAAYNIQWTPAYRDERVIDQLLVYGDWIAAQDAADASIIEGDWSGASAMGSILINAWPAVEKRMADQATINGKPITRSQAWAATLLHSVDYWRTHRRSYTNQSMIVDQGIYVANRGLALIDPGKAISEQRTLSFLYQSMGIEPWLGSDERADGVRVADSPDQGTAKPYGNIYHLITHKGLSRELGWVATYGETILHFGVDIAKLTGDAKIRAQLAKMAHARMYFRYPAVDGDGFKCMKLVSEVDNRTAHYPLSGSAYVAPNIREEWWMDVPALLSDDPIIVGVAQQSIEDVQYFAYIKSRLKDPDTLGMMRNVDEYEKVKALPPSAHRLPMGDEQPDFVFADEEDAVLTIKNGSTRLFVNMYYRAERSVNNVVRLYELEPTLTRIATVQSQTKVRDSGHTYTRPDRIDWPRAPGMPPPGQDLHQAWAGEVMPVSPRPQGAQLPAYGDWGPFLGKADFYQLQYGDYFIAMNCADEKTYPLDIPAKFAHAKDLVSGKNADELSKSLKPLSTVVLFARPETHQ